MHIMQNQQKKTKQISPLAAGITGVVIGAAGAAAIALADKDTRKKATGKAKQVKTDLHKWSSKTIKDLQSNGEKIKADSKDKIEDNKTAVSKQLKDKIDETFK